MIGRKIWKVGDWVMLLAILFSIVVQFNDPDPFAWIAIYGLAAGASVLGLLGRGHWACPAVVGLVASAADFGAGATATAVFRDVTVETKRSV